MPNANSCLRNLAFRKPVQLVWKNSRICWLIGPLTAVQPGANSDVVSKQGTPPPLPHTHIPAYIICLMCVLWTSIFNSAAGENKLQVMLPTFALSQLVITLTHAVQVTDHRTKAWHMSKQHVAATFASPWQHRVGTCYTHVQSSPWFWFLQIIMHPHSAIELCVLAVLTLIVVQLTLRHFSGNALHPRYSTCNILFAFALVSLAEHLSNVTCLRAELQPRPLHPHLLGVFVLHLLHSGPAVALRCASRCIHKGIGPCDYHVLGHHLLDHAGQTTQTVLSMLFLFCGRGLVCRRLFAWLHTTPWLGGYSWGCTVR